ncbi:SLATT domain-containing protein [Muricoccus pecuniae]|uniref:SMODS and SLOG-associating 2TM effector domain-containing protein n=1 Tax=Muricoccus pecuniae TaxID=693023 RepID=A0A840YBS7_9PROT|nr:SLATT domain-containing protein [Roseomonas pecuniae]MBB5693521.1 hypothetical protein [Roseomonas pecuniae]
MMNSNPTAADALYKKMWTTRGSRFVARSRYRVMNTLSVSSISALSVFLIAISVAAIVFQQSLTGLGQNLLNVFGVIASVGILAFSLIEGLRNHLGNSERMNESALSIGRLYEEFGVGYRSGRNEENEVRDYVRRYSEILEKYPLNHSSVDYMKFRADHAADFGLAGAVCLPLRVCMRVSWWFSICWVYAVVMLLVPAGLLTTLWLYSSVLIK